MKNRIQGCLWGVVLGDALGAPLEMFSAEKIKELHGRVENFVEPKGHKWFDGQPLGFTTDDTQLTLCVVRAFLEAGDFNMDAIAQKHVETMKKTMDGWGKSTRESIRNLQNNVHWSKSGYTKNPHRGTGNGVPMKIAPLALFPIGNRKDPGDQYKAMYDRTNGVAQFAAMTHYTDMAVISGYAQYYAIMYCTESTEVTPHIINETNVNMSWQAYVNARNLFDPPLNKTEDNILEKLRNTQEPRENGCYVYDSLPFVHYHFVQNPTFEGMLNVVNAGGDTDTNASMFGALLGALKGIDVFPQELIKQVQNYSEINSLINDFADLCLSFEKEEK